MSSHILVWDLETIPDLPCVARVHRLDEQNEAACREALGEKFPKLPFHKIACIGALIAERREGVWHVLSLGAPHVGGRSEAEIIESFVTRIAEYRPQMVTFNGASFDLPVLRYRAMINRVSAPGLECRRYWHRYSDDCLDLCDALACYSAGAKVSLNDLCRSLDLPGKPDAISGGDVDTYVQQGRIGEVAAYCETDVVSTYRVLLIYELFRGTLTRREFDCSEANLLEFVRERVAVKPHLAYLLGTVPPELDRARPQAGDASPPLAQVTTAAASCTRPAGAWQPGPG
jgi:predicted PolB exonuclease-like 3'-5' exonuclease